MTPSYKIDLHTHSIISYDGGLTEKDYRNCVTKNIVDIIAITDHNEISFALFLQKKLGNHIIVGEEVRTTEGEVIGLFLSEKIPSGLSLSTTIAHIHDQKGLVYIPHPFETARESISLSTFQKHIKHIDIVEVFNARSYGRKKTNDANEIVKTHQLAKASSSDAHCMSGIASSYSIIYNKPTKESIGTLLINGRMEEKYAPFISYLCPFINKVKHRLHI